MVTHLYQNGQPVRGVWLGSTLQSAMYKGSEKVWPPSPDVSDTFNRATLTSYRDAVLADSPDVYFAVDDASGNFAALAGTAATAVATWAYQEPGLILGASGYSVKATNGTARGDFGTQLSSTASLTLSLWFMPTSIGTAGSIMEVGGSGEGTQIVLGTDGRITVYNAAVDYDVQHPTVLQAGKPVHIAVVHDATNTRMQVFVDGVRYSVFISPIGNAAGTDPGNFGSAHNSIVMASDPTWGTPVSAAAIGHYDEIAGWRSALSEEAIQAHLAAMSPLGITEVGNKAWEEAGELAIVDNKLEGDNDATYDIAHVEANPDGVVAASFGGSGAMGIVFRYVDANNYWFLGRFTEFGNLILDKVVNGTATNMANIGFEGHHIVWVHLDGSDITIYSAFSAIDLDLAPAFGATAPTGNRKGSYIDSTHASANRVGVALRENTSWCDEFRYWYPLAPRTPLEDLNDVAHTVFDFQEENNTDGERVSRITDRTGNGHHAYNNGTDVTKPTARTTNGMKYGEWLGGNDYLDTTTFPVAPQPVTWIVLARWTSGVQTINYMFGSLTSAADRNTIYVFRTSDNRWGWTAGTDGTAGVAADNGWHVHVVVFNGTNSMWYIDGDLIDIADKGTGGVINISFGSHFVGGSWEGDLGFLAFYDGNLLTDDPSLANAVGQELANRAGITWTNIS